MNQSSLTENLTIALKSCPFCGTKALLKSTPEDGRRKNKVWQYYVVCSGSFFFKKSNNGCGTITRTKMESSAKEAAETWNNRTGVRRQLMAIRSRWYHLPKFPSQNYKLQVLDEILKELENEISVS
jgi:hypothetical protein